MHSNRYYDLDLLRFIAAMAVVLFHFTFRGYAAHDLSILEYPFLGEIFKYGSFGVELFFMISGFVIFMSAYNKPASSFVIGRITRLYPAYWVGIVLTTVVWIMTGQDKFKVELDQFIANLSMIHGFFWIKHVDGVYWTLMYELKFYFLIFLLLLLNSLQHAKMLFFVWLGFCLVTIFNLDISILEFFLFPEYAGFFIAGSVLYLIKEEGWCKWKTLLLICSYMLSCYTAIQEYVFEDNLLHRNISVAEVIVIISCFFIIMAMVALRKTSLINTPKMLTLGALTYPLYLTHQNIGYMLINILGTELNKYLVLTIVLLISLIIAYVIHNKVEKAYGLKMKVFLERNWENLWVKLKNQGT